MLHHACQTTPESMQRVKMCNVSKQSTTAPQAKAISTPSTTHPSPIPKQCCHNYQTNNCRRTNCKFLHEIDPKRSQDDTDNKEINKSCIDS